MYFRKEVVHCIDHRISPGARDDGGGEGSCKQALQILALSIIVCIYREIRGEGIHNQLPVKILLQEERGGWMSRGRG